MASDEHHNGMVKKSYNRWSRGKNDDLLGLGSGSNLGKSRGEVGKGTHSGWTKNKLTCAGGLRLSVKQEGGGTAK